MDKLIEERRKTGLPFQAHATAAGVECDSKGFTVDQVYDLLCELINEDKDKYKCPVTGRILQVEKITSVERDTDLVKEKIKSLECDIAVSCNMLCRAANYPFLTYTFNFCRLGENLTSVVQKIIGRICRDVTEEDIKKLPCCMQDPELEKRWIESLRKLKREKKHIGACIFDIEDAQNINVFSRFASENFLGNLTEEEMQAKEHIEGHISSSVETIDIIINNESDDEWIYNPYHNKACEVFQKKEVLRSGISKENLLKEILFLCPVEKFKDELPENCQSKYEHPSTLGLGYAVKYIKQKREKGLQKDCYVYKENSLYKFHINTKEKEQNLNVLGNETMEIESSHKTINGDTNTLMENINMELEEEQIFENETINSEEAFEKNTTDLVENFGRKVFDSDKVYEEENTGQEESDEELIDAVKTVNIEEQELQELTNDWQASGNESQPINIDSDEEYINDPNELSDEETDEEDEGESDDSRDKETGDDVDQTSLDKELRDLLDTQNTTTGKRKRNKKSIVDNLETIDLTGDNEVSGFVFDKPIIRVPRRRVSENTITQKDFFCSICNDPKEKVFVSIQDLASHWKWMHTLNSCKLSHMFRYDEIPLDNTKAEQNIKAYETIKELAIKSRRDYEKINNTELYKDVEKVEEILTCIKSMETGDAPVIKKPSYLANHLLWKLGNGQLPPVNIAFYKPRGQKGATRQCEQNDETKSFFIRNVDYGHIREHDKGMMFAGMEVVKIGKDEIQIAESCRNYLYFKDGHPHYKKPDTKRRVGAPILFVFVDFHCVVSEQPTDQSRVAFSVALPEDVQIPYPSRSTSAPKRSRGATAEDELEIEHPSKGCAVAGN